MSESDKKKWRSIGRDAWRLAKEAAEKHKAENVDPYDYIWEHVKDYAPNDYEAGVMGEWACTDCEYLLSSIENLKFPPN